MFKPADGNRRPNKGSDETTSGRGETDSPVKEEVATVGTAASLSLNICDSPEQYQLRTVVLAHRAFVNDLADKAPHVENELCRILSSATFRRSNRLRRMLEYLTRQLLSGSCDRLKEYTIGLEVFDRDPSFDPASDPIVRVEVSRLRHQLSRYYGSEGKHSTLRIDLPKGTYIPVICEGFGHTSSCSPGPRAVAKGILVLPFLLWGDSYPANPSQTLVVSDQLIYLLTQSSPFRVLSRFAAMNAAPEMDAQQLGRHFNARFIIEGSVRIAGEDCSIVTHLVDAEHSCNLWSGRYHTTPEGLLSVADSTFADLMKCLEIHADQPVYDTTVKNKTGSSYKL